MNALEKYLESKKCFKLVLGANNADYENITKICALYSSVGCTFFDIQASIKAYNALCEGLKYSKIKREDVFVCASAGVNQDPHLTKFKIDKNLCKNCTKCKDKCLQGAITNIEDEKTNNNSNIFIDEKRCIGCAKCYTFTKCPALKSYQKTRNWEDFLPYLFNKVDCIEFHAICDDIDEINKKWDYLCSNFKGMLSVCVDRSFFGDRKMILQLDNMISSAKRKIIIQSDGAPMSGGEDDYNTTLQTVAFADIINKNNLNAYIILSGGTNSKTSKLAQMLNVKYNGVAFGSFARKIIKEYISCDDFLSSKEKFKKAQEIAQKLFDTI